MPVLIVDNDFEFPDAVVWELDTLVAGSTDELVRGPFTLDATFFSRTDSGFWSEGEPDAAFRIEGSCERDVHLPSVRGVAWGELQHDVCMDGGCVAPEQPADDLRGLRRSVFCGLPAGVGGVCGSVCVGAHGQQ